MVTRRYRAWGKRKKQRRSSRRGSPGSGLPYYGYELTGNYTRHPTYANPYFHSYEMSPLSGGGNVWSPWTPALLA